jgi:DNA-binding IclR family transcriptional regulator
MTFTEVAKGAGLSTQLTNDHLHRLVEQGVVLKQSDGRYIIQPFLREENLDAVAGMHNLVVRLAAKEVTAVEGADPVETVLAMFWLAQDLVREELRGQVSGFARR